jgi:hypothetical protein
MISIFISIFTTTSLDTRVYKFNNSKQNYLKQKIDFNNFTKTQNSAASNKTFYKIVNLIRKCKWQFSRDVCAVLCHISLLL